jgi:hypothetical protein
MSREQPSRALLIFTTRGGSRPADRDGPCRDALALLEPLVENLVHERASATSRWTSPLARDDMWRDRVQCAIDRHVLVARASRARALWTRPNANTAVFSPPDPPPRTWEATPSIALRLPVRYTIALRSVTSHNCIHREDPVSKEIFETIDAHGDGFITVLEPRAHLLHTLGGGTYEEYRSKVCFLSHDTDGDAKLSFEEFETFVEEEPELFAE